MRGCRVGVLRLVVVRLEVEDLVVTVYVIGTVMLDIHVSIQFLPIKTSLERCERKLTNTALPPNLSLDTSHTPHRHSRIFYTPPANLAPSPRRAMRYAATHMPQSGDPCARHDYVAQRSAPRCKDFS